MNIRIENHPLVGTVHTYRADLPPHPEEDAAKDSRLVIANGYKAEILAAFENWNDVAGLDMLYVRCLTTRHTTHVTPGDLGLPPLS